MWLGTLGKITPDPDKVFGVIRDNLKKSDTDDKGQPTLAMRQVAAYALVDLWRYSNLLPYEASS